MDMWSPISFFIYKSLNMACISVFLTLLISSRWDFRTCISISTCCPKPCKYEWIIIFQWGSFMLFRAYASYSFFLKHFFPYTFPLIDNSMFNVGIASLFSKSFSDHPKKRVEATHWLKQLIDWKFLYSSSVSNYSSSYMVIFKKAASIHVLITVVSPSKLGKVSKWK